MTTSKKTTQAPKPAPEVKQEEVEEVAQEAAKTPSVEDLMAVIAQLQEKLETVESRADRAGLPAPQSVHQGPKEPVTKKTEKGNIRTDR